MSLRTHTFQFKLRTFQPLKLSSFNIHHSTFYLVGGLDLLRAVFGDLVGDDLGIV